MDETFDWCGYEWRTQERWGVLHPEKPWAWYWNYCARVTPENDLELKIIKCKRAITVDDVTYHPTYGMGLVSTTENNRQFKFGLYTWIAKMPKGKHLWPGLWMWSWDKWPPEIDVAEAWTNDCGGYFRFNYKWNLFQWNIQTNVHDANADHSMAQTIPILKGFLKNPAKNFIKYQLMWTEKYLEFYYDGGLVRRIDDPEFMTYLNTYTQRGMNIVMNVYPTKDYQDGDMKTPLLIKYFSYVPI